MTKPKRPAHRPVEMKGGKRVNVYLDAASLKRAAELGGGNVSAGIREALRQTRGAGSGSKGSAFTPRP